MTVRIFLILLLFLTATALLSIVIIIWRKKRLRDKFYFSLFVASVSLYCGAYASQLTGSTLEWHLFFTKIVYIGISVMPTLWILMAAQHTSRDSFLRPSIRFLLWSLSITTLILVWTSQYHNFYYIKMRLDESGFIPNMIFEKGIWYWVHMGYLNIAFFIGNYLFLRSWLTSSARYRKQSAILFFSSIIPWIGIVVYLTGILKIGINIAPFTLAFSCFFLYVGIMKYSLADIVPIIARDLVFESIYDAVIVLDDTESIADCNKAASDMFSTDSNSLVGKKISLAASSHPHLLEFLHQSRLNQVIAEDVEIAGGVYNTRFIPIINKKSETVGNTLVLREITDYVKSREQINKLLSEKELLLKEVHHRIKNNMSTVMSLLEFQKMSLGDTLEAEILDDAVNRIHSMMVLYDKLYSSKDFENISAKQYLPALIEGIISNFPERVKITREISIDDFVLEEKVLSPLGILVNEVLTNIMKFAFTGRSEGSIKVSAEKNDQTITIIIQDNGIGFPENFDYDSSLGFGLELVKKIAVQLNGTIAFEQKNGTIVTLIFDQQL